MAESTPGRPSTRVEYRWEPSVDGLRTLVVLKENQTVRAAFDRQDLLVSWVRKNENDGKEWSLQASSLPTRPDGCPWIQDMTQLGSFGVGSATELRFVGWADRLDSRLGAASWTSFRATKVRRETRPEAGAEPLWKVHVTFDDLRAAFWGADYWYRIRDGQMVAYEEVRGGPGTPVTTGRLLERHP